MATLSFVLVLDIKTIWFFNNFGSYVYKASFTVPWEKTTPKETAKFKELGQSTLDKVRFLLSNAIAINYFITFLQTIDVTNFLLVFI